MLREIISTQKCVERHGALVEKLSAEERLKFISEILVDYDGARSIDGLCDLMDEVRGYAAAVLPTAEWQKDGTCSHCGMEPLLDYDFRNELERYAWKFSPYCPHCGMKMRNTKFIEEDKNNDDENEDD